MKWFNRSEPEPERTEADEVRELREAYAEMAAPQKDFWARFPLVFQAAFGLLSFLGTYIGLNDIISTGDLNAGSVGDMMVFGLVALATAAMIYFLRRAIADPWTMVGFGSILAYLILVFFSVTFGFAFYWGRLEARQQAISGATARLEDFSDKINITAVGLRRTVDELTTLEGEFRRLAQVEETVGGTCGDGSAGGFGPRTRHRQRRADEIASRVTQLKPRFESVAPSVAALETKMAEIQALGRRPADEVTGEVRQALFRDARQTARTAAVEINSLAQDPLLADAAAVFHRWGQEYKTPNMVRGDDPAGAPYVCYQVAAGDALSGAGDRLSSLPTVDVPDLPDYAGPAATREAVFRMLRTVSGGASDLWAGLPLIGGGGETRFDQASTEAAYRAGVDAALTSDRGGAAQDNPLLHDTGLLPQDRFPLLVAIIVDALLFVFVLIDRAPSQYFGRFQRKIRNAIAEKLDPLEMVALRRSLNDDPNWGLLRRYRFTINDRIYIAQPLDLKRQTDPESVAAAAEVEMLQDLLLLWRRNGLVRRQDLTSEEIRAELRRAGADWLADDYREFRAFKFTDHAFEVILMRGLFVGGSEPAELLKARARKRISPPPSPPVPAPNHELEPAPAYELDAAKMAGPVTRRSEAERRRAREEAAGPDAAPKPEPKAETKSEPKPEPLYADSEPAPSARRPALLPNFLRPRGER